MSNNNKSMRPIMNHSLRQFAKKRVAVYARVSRTGEWKHESIEAQKRNLAADIEKHPGWTFAGYYVDEGVTGTKMNRPEFNRMMDDARAGKLDIILTKTVSRFGRNMAAVLKVLQELKEMDVIVIFDNENISTADKDSLIRLQYNSIMAEREAKQNSDNKKWSIRKRFEQGIPNYIRIYGYQMVDNELQIVPEEAKVVKQIFDMYLSGMGRGAITRKLNKDGVPSPYGVIWRARAVYDILRNEKYTGDLILQKWYRTDFITKKKKLNNGELPKFFIENNHAAIIDKETFAAVQAEIARRVKINDGITPRSGNNSPANDSANKGDNCSKIFKQLICCPQCNKHFIYKTITNHQYKRELWMCINYWEFGTDICQNKAIPEKILCDITREVMLYRKLIKENTPITNDLLMKHIRKIIAYDNQTLEYHFADGEIVVKEWQFASRSKSWTPEMKQKARERTLARNAKKKEEEAYGQNKTN